MEVYTFLTVSLTRMASPAQASRVPRIYTPTRPAFTRPRPVARVSRAAAPHLYRHEPLLRNFTDLTSP